MNILDKINQLELEKYKGNKEIKNIPLKSEVEVEYLTPNGDLRLFRGIVIALEINGVNSTVSVVQNSANAGKRMIYKFIYYSPSVKQIKVLRNCSKTPRRAKLNYFAKLYGKKARI